QRSALQTELATSFAASRKRVALLQKEVETSTKNLSRIEQYLNLKKQAEADRQLYESLYAKIKEAGISAASKSSNIRVVEEARVLDHPTRPRPFLNLLAGGLFGLMGAVILAFVKEGLEHRINTSEDIRRWTG